MEIRTQTKATLTLISGMILYMLEGYEMSWGTFSPYLTSYQHHYNPSITSMDLNLALPMMYAGTTIGFSNLQAVACPYTEAKLGLKLNLTLGLFSFIIGLMFTLLTFNTTVVITVYGLLVGFACGCFIVSAVWPVWSYFQDQKGWVTGLMFVGMSSGTGAVSLLFPLVANPEALPTQQMAGEVEGYFPPEVAENYVGVTIYLAVAVVLVGSFAIFAISVNEKANVEEQEKCPKISQLSRTWEFWKLFFTFFFCMVYWMYILGNFKELGLQFINDDRLLSVTGTIGTLASAIGRFTWPTLLDKYDFKTIITVALSLNLILGIIFPFTLSYPMAYCIITVMLFFVSVAYFPSVLVQCGNTYGNNGSKVFSYINIGMCLAAFWVSGVKYLMPRIGLSAGLYILVSSCAIALILVLRKEQRVMKTELVETLL